MKKDWFLEASPENLSNGYVYHKEKETYVCLFCHESFQDGVIYPVGDVLLEAKRAIRQHIIDAHGSVFDYLIRLDKKDSGLSEIQRELLTYFYEGVSDQEIAKKMDAKSTSTIRNHRFKLREKERQAKVFLAIMSLLKKKREDEPDDFVIFHKGAKMVDERYATTNKEKEKILSTYFKEGLDGRLSIFPSKEKRKLIVLQHMISRFESDKMYSEQEVNEKIKEMYDDFATIRRYFIEYGFMDRNKDGSRYWVKK
ncbi:DUF2087 domain-containing protein [Fervidibacillus albus]|uniref:DUF2087 domain-containing protein n=1 Tax=Fervidibacillus albus TaxID=2980026 RepID=A0A9E8LTD7_9BACI|nr:DUF2087 domain-containing protein [Fervidibacillus albus]WAA08846.1 DUF2087 domain-containing protein [Fervidibacillus albus]